MLFHLLTREVYVAEKDVAALLPLTPLSFQILLALADGERHGYGIMKEIDRRTKGRMTPATGPLYLAAQRLMDQGLIAESEKRPAPEMDDQRRRYYKLTEFGRRVAAAEVERMAHLVGVALEKRLADGQIEISVTQHQGRSEPQRWNARDLEGR
ncbi:MAG: helix-turn-helix transcriptional regulator [Gemmatimonadota bacterium]|nr:MAG: helix-turn-helix transcriptional regulator [Gemmatimonadota bacterium]